jgi:hypothetical protein
MRRKQVVALKSAARLASRRTNMAIRAIRSSMAAASVLIVCAIVFAILFAIVVPACGGGGSSPSTDASSPQGTGGAAVDSSSDGSSDLPGGEADGARDRPSAQDGAACPAAAPFDDSDPDVVARCTRPVVVAVGNGLRRAVSYDGQVWAHDEWFPDQNADQNENSHRDVAIALGLIVISGDGGLLVSADGGATFTVAVPARMHTSSVVFFRGAFWVVSTAGTYSSTDGAQWAAWPSTTPLPGGLPGGYDATAAATDGQQLVALNGHDSSYRVFDGTTWVQRSFGAEYGMLAKLAYGAGRYVMLSQACCDETMFAGLRATSTDAASWSLVTNASPGAPNYRFGDLIWDGARFFATGSPYDNRGYSSTNGLDWTPWTLKDAQGGSVALAAAAAFEGGYVGAHTTGLYHSADAVTWMLTHTAVGDATWGFIRIASGRILAP